MFSFFGLNIALRRDRIMSVFTRTIASLEDLVNESYVKIEKREEKAVRLEEKASALRYENSQDNEELNSVDALLAKLREFVQ